jgi:hypothetical protein
MKWKKIFAPANQAVYELWNEDKKLITLDFHPSTNSARVENEVEKRVFLIRKEGFLKNKTVLCNEYGVRLGYLINENNENHIRLNDQRFTYTIENNEGAELVIYDEVNRAPLVVCGLDTGKEKNSAKQDSRIKSLPVNALSWLLLALGWYMLQPAKKNELEYA